MPFVELDAISANRELLKQRVFEGLAAKFPGWEAAPGNLETVLVEQLADIGADLTEVATDVPPEIFRGFGTKIVNVPAQLAQSATVESTWTLVDDAGYTIPAGTPVALLVTGSESVGFFTLQEVIVPAGETTTATGEVILTAAVAGSDPNGLENLEVSVLDNLDFVSSVEMEGVVSGGADEEEPDDYNDRLADELRLLSPRPILPEDFAILSRRVEGVWRATAIDGFDPTDDSTGNERTVTVVAIDEDGTGVGSTVRDEIDALLEGEREVNFQVFVDEPTDNEIKVSATVVCYPGYDPDEVEVSVAASLSNYLSAKNWGLDPTGADQRAWRNVTTVRRLELVALIDRIPGVDYITALTLAKEADSLGTSDVTLTGVAPLPSPGTLIVSAS